MTQRTARRREENSAEHLIDDAGIMVASNRNAADRNIAFGPGDHSRTSPSPRCRYRQRPPELISVRGEATFRRSPIKSRRSLPKNISYSTKNVGTPNTPRVTARSPLEASFAFTSVDSVISHNSSGSARLTANCERPAALTRSSAPAQTASNKASFVGSKTPSSWLAMAARDSRSLSQSPSDSAARKGRLGKKGTP